MKNFNLEQHNAVYARFEWVHKQDCICTWIFDRPEKLDERWHEVPKLSLSLDNGSDSDEQKALMPLLGDS
jgi:hypothetical protein